MSESFFCAEFWNDLKKARKQAPHKALFETSLNPEEFEVAPVSLKIDTLPILKAVFTAISNKAFSIEDIADKHDQQPFLEVGWVVYKLRWAVDKRGKPGGLRIIFCLNKDSIIFVCLKFKKEVENEGKFAIESLGRIKEFLDLKK